MLFLHIAHRQPVACQRRAVGFDVQVVAAALRSAKRWSCPDRPHHRLDTPRDLLDLTEIATEHLDGNPCPYPGGKTRSER
jgi:hypothetical protein